MIMKKTRWESMRKKGKKVIHDKLGDYEKEQIRKDDKKR